MARIRTRNTSESNMESSPALLLAAAQTAKNLVHARGAVDDFQEGFFLEVIHFVLAALSLDLVDRRALGDQFGHCGIDDQNFENPGPSDVSGALTGGANDLLPPLVQL